MIYYWCPARQILPSSSVVTKNCKTYCSPFDASELDWSLISTDGPYNSISQSFPTAGNLCAIYAPYTQEAESGLLDLCNRAGIFSAIYALGILIYYINTSEIPGELSSVNMISSHVKIYRLLHVKSLISFLFTSL